jgi:anion-transporting  ArsA/GET3 family ATPase
MFLPIEIPETERTPLVNWLLNLVAEQKQVIENQEKTIADLERKVGQLEERVKGLDEELKAAKKLKSRPNIKPSTLNQEKKTLLLEELRELGIDISAGQVNRILIENKESFQREQEQVFQVGLSTAEYIHTDDTGARHQGHPRILHRHR